MRLAHKGMRKDICTTQTSDAILIVGKNSSN